MAWSALSNHNTTTATTTTTTTGSKSSYHPHPHHPHQRRQRQQQHLFGRRLCFTQCLVVALLVNLSLSAKATSFAEQKRLNGRCSLQPPATAAASDHFPKLNSSFQTMATRRYHTAAAAATPNEPLSSSNVDVNAVASASQPTDICQSINSGIETRGGETSPKGWFTRTRETIFPIYGQQEVTKFLLIGAIKFFVILALTLTRDTKDTLVVTQCGAEAIAFLKIYGVLPAATAYIALYSELSNVLSKQALFYTTCIPFFIFFGVFDLFIYPNVNLLHPPIETVRTVLRAIFGVKGTMTTTGGIAVLANICAHWTSALFYVMAEIYSSVSVGLLFWQFANDVVPMDQAKRFYPLFAQMSGLAPVLAGQYVVRYASRAPDFATSFRRLTAAVTLSGLAICLFYKASCAFVERTEGWGQEKDTAIKKKKKSKPSMADSAKFLAKSQYLRLIATLVLGYGLSINFTEIMWKSLVKKQYPNPLDYQRFMGNFSSVVGASTCVVIFFGVHVIRLLGWRVGAMATPAVMAVIAIPFFSCILLGLDSPARLQTAVLCGTILSLLSKTAKYALFDPTTQMAYIPLDDESKVKGKAAIDVLGSRIGKSGGSLIQQGLVFGFGNILSAAPAVLLFYYGVLMTWLAAANRLSGLFHAQSQVEHAGRLDESKKSK